MNEKGADKIGGTNSTGRRMLKGKRHGLLSRTGITKSGGHRGG